MTCTQSLIHAHACMRAGTHTPTHTRTPPPTLHSALPSGWLLAVTVYADLRCLLLVCGRAQPLQWTEQQCWDSSRRGRRSGPGVFWWHRSQQQGERFSFSHPCPSGSQLTRHLCSCVWLGCLSVGRSVFASEGVLSSWIWNPNYILGNKLLWADIGQKSLVMNWGLLSLISATAGVPCWCRNFSPCPSSVFLCGARGVIPCVRNWVSNAFLPLRGSVTSCFWAICSQLLFKMHFFYIKGKGSIFF